MGDPVLCYVNDPWAYFTTQPLEKQRGDDWNDIPYEYNAGRPYEWREQSDGQGCQCIDPDGKVVYSGRAVCGKPGHVAKAPRDRWEIIKVAFEAPLETPSSWTTSSYSVQMINRGAAPWLQTDRYSARKDRVLIYAGVSLVEFCEMVRRAGGVVYLATEFPQGVRSSDAMGELHALIAERPPGR